MERGIGPWHPPVHPLLVHNLLSYRFGSLQVPEQRVWNILYEEGVKRGKLQNLIPAQGGTIQKQWDFP